MKTTYETGVAGEQTAADWLINNRFMKLLESRLRNKAGEIDLIMQENDTIVFVEVKTRLHAAPGSGLIAVDRKKQQRIAKAAMLYLMENNLLKRSVRFDVTEVTANEVIHIPNAFQPGNLFYR